MNAKIREPQPSPPDSRRRGRLRVRPSEPFPQCEACAEADVELYCECCGQEQCRSCWADGDGALCGGCRGRAWDDVPPEDSVSPVGLLLGDDEQQWSPRPVTSIARARLWGATPLSPGFRSLAHPLEF